MNPPRTHNPWQFRDGLRFVQGYFRVSGKIVKRKLAGYGELGIQDDGTPIDKTVRARKARASLLQKRWDAIDAKLQGSSPGGTGRTIARVFSDWLKESAGTRAPATVDLYARVRDNYLAAIEDHPIGEISPFQLNRFIGWLSGRVAPNTVRQRCAILRAFLHWAVEHGDLPGVPRFRMPEKEVKLPRVLTEVEVERLEVWLDVLSRFGPPRNRRNYRLHHRALMVGLGTGAREAEVFNLLWNDIDLADSRIAFRITPTAKIKERKDKVVPLPRWLADYLKAEHPPRGPERWLIDDGAGRQAFYGPKALRLALRRHMDFLRIGQGVKPFHGLRALYAHRLRERGVSIHTIKNLLGHRQVTTTEGYFPASDTPEVEAVSLLD